MIVPAHDGGSSASGGSDSVEPIRSRISATEPLGYLCHRLMNIVRAVVTMDVLEPVGLTFTQYVCLQMLARAPGISNAQLARDANVSPQAMHAIVQELQGRGLLTRPARVAFGRARPAMLTEAGAALLERIDAGVQAVEREALAALPESEQGDFMRMLSVVVGSPSR